MLFLPEEQLPARQSYTLSQLRTACQNRCVLTARAYLFDANRQLHFHLGCCEGILPFEDSALEAASGTLRDIAILSRVGRLTCFQVRSLEKDTAGRTVAWLDRAAAQRLCRESYFDRLQPGDILPARVTSIEGFGAFCDVGYGLIALLPIDYLSVSRIRSPKDRVTVGQSIFCVVRKRDELGRLVLSMKELLGTWEENARHFSAGETVIGRVRGLESYGIFVELTPNLAGLAELRPEVSIGDCVRVYIKSIQPEKMKIKLIILDRIDELLPLPPLPFVHTQGRLTRWNYASSASGRCMETVFE